MFSFPIPVKVCLLRCVSQYSMDCVENTPLWSLVRLKCTGTCFRAPTHCVQTTVPLLCFLEDNVCQSAAAHHELSERESL